MSIDRIEEIEDYIMELYDLRFEHQNQNIDILIERISETRYFIQGRYKPPYYKLEFIPESFTCGSWTEDEIQLPAKGESHFRQVLITPEIESKILQHINYKIDVVYAGKLKTKVDKIIESSRKRLGLDWVVTTQINSRLDGVTGYDKCRSIFYISNREDYKEICDYINKPNEYSVTSSQSSAFSGQFGMSKDGPPILSPPLPNFYY